MHSSSKSSVSPMQLSVQGGMVKVWGMERNDGTIQVTLDELMLETERPGTASKYFRTC